MAVALLDSSAIVAYLVADDALHESAAQALESTLSRGGALVMSAVTWNETLYGALLGHLPEGALRELARDFGIDILPVDQAVAEQAAILQRAYRGSRRSAPKPRLRTPDALILATALVHTEIDTIVAGDAQWQKVPGIDADIVLLSERRESR